ncbi:MAG TPA: hypothetical protein VEL31_10655 [Ktedonobacteraceae bacterium]|nr:hypothetical protein [Ktedonobacteraceae bacterium]
MQTTLSQAVKQARKTGDQCDQRATGASLYAFPPVLRPAHLSVHCQTMSGSGVYIPHGYMHNRYCRAFGKATNKRRMNDYFSPWKRACQTSTLPLRKSKSQEVA